jgi:hypothetical protein
MQRWARQRSTHLNNIKAQISENDVIVRWSFSIVLYRNFCILYNI